jgi:hypothetical protein
MPHKIFEPQKFNEEVIELRKRFVQSAENSLFLPDSHQKDISINDLPAFIKQVWATIKN